MHTIHKESDQERRCVRILIELGSDEEVGNERRGETISKMRSISAHNKIVKKWNKKSSAEHNRKGQKKRNAKCKEICNGKEFQLLPICAFGIQQKEKKLSKGDQKRE